MKMSENTTEWEIWFRNNGNLDSTIICSQFMPTINEIDKKISEDNGDEGSLIFINLESITNTHKICNCEP